MSVSGPPADQERFIPGIYNYCDSWCSACRLAARCRVKADTDAEPTPETPEAFAAQIRSWFRKALDLAEEHARERGVDVSQIEALGDAAADSPPPVSIDHARLVSRAKAYGLAIFSWQKRRPPDPQRRTELDPTFPQDVIDHFAFMIGSKVQRAVSALALEREDNTRGKHWPRDSDGSAKVAILAAERSRTAWSDLRDSGLVGNDAVQTFEESLTWLIGELERVFPNARSFVRPGFDQPTSHAEAGPSSAL